MSLLRVAAGVVLVAFAARLAGAQPVATQPAADLSTPGAAVVSVYKLLLAGDIDNARSCMSFADAEQAESFDINVVPLWKPLALMHALEAKFGADARNLFSSASLEKTAGQAIDEVGRCEIVVNCDTATLNDKRAAVDPAAETQVNGITLKKTGDQWKVVASSFPEGAGDIPAAQLPMMRNMKSAVVAACEATLARLARGDFKNADDAYSAYQESLKQHARAPAAANSR